MAENCNGNCGSCAENCTEREEQQTDFRERPNVMSHIRKVIAIVSGKGGVGKSSVTSMLAVSMRRLGYRVAILDADITGPSIPKAFGITEKASGSDVGIFPIISRTGIRLMSINLLLEHDTDPVIWRGPILGGTVKQFWTDVIWGDIDYMFIDMPPGTGDVPLTVFQSLNVDGIVIVTSPQELVSMIVSKAVKMAEMMHIPVLGVVENLAYFKCPDNDKEYKIFGESHIEEIAEKHQMPVLAKIPIDPRISAVCDRGIVELFDGDWFESAVKILEQESETGNH